MVMTMVDLDQPKTRVRRREIKTKTRAIQHKIMETNLKVQQMEILTKMAHREEPTNLLAILVKIMEENQQTGKQSTVGTARK